MKPFVLLAIFLVLCGVAVMPKAIKAATVQGVRVIVWACTVSEPVTIADRSKLKITNGRLESFRFDSPQSMTLYVRPVKTNAYVSIQFEDGFCVDEAGNTNVAVKSSKWAN